MADVSRGDQYVASFASSQDRCRRQDNIHVQGFIISGRIAIKASLGPEFGGLSEHHSTRGHETEKATELIQSGDTTNLARPDQFTANLIIGDLGDHHFPPLIETVAKPGFATEG
jgi:hypothetical protein